MERTVLFAVLILSLSTTLLFAEETTGIVCIANDVEKSALVDASGNIIEPIPEEFLIDCDEKIRDPKTGGLTGGEKTEAERNRGLNGRQVKLNRRVKK